jgi:hypothetical protein
MFQSGSRKGLDKLIWILFLLPNGNYFLLMKVIRNIFQKFVLMALKLCIHVRSEKFGDIVDGL